MKTIIIRRIRTQRRRNDNLGMFVIGTPTSEYRYNKDRNFPPQLTITYDLPSYPTRSSPYTYMAGARVFQGNCQRRPVRRMRGQAGELVAVVGPPYLP
jgi:hypothetical protein